MQKEWWSTPTVAWAFTVIGIGGGAVLTYISPYVGIPIGIGIFAFGIYLLIRAYRIERKALKSPLNPGEKQWQLNLVKLFHDGKDIRSKLKKAQNNTNTTEQVSSELYFESWFTDVTNALENTDYKKMWYENKVVDYQKDQISEYLSASDRALERLESIIELTSHKEGSHI